jgi:hypothetical protein
MWFLKKLFKKRDEQLVGDGDIVKPFLDHLEDLRWTLLKMISVLAFAMVFAFAFRTTITSVLAGPLDKAVPGAKLIFIDPVESVTLSFTHRHRRLVSDAVVFSRRVSAARADEEGEKVCAARSRGRFRTFSDGSAALLLLRAAADAALAAPGR